jgi:hypothetical protein
MVYFYLQTSPMLPNHLIPPIRLPGTACVDDTLLPRSGTGLFSDERICKFGQPEAPLLALAPTHGMGGDLASTRHLKDAAARDTEKFCRHIGGHKRLNVAIQCCDHGANFLNVSTTSNPASIKTSEKKSSVGA